MRPAILSSVQVGTPRNYGFEDAVNPHDKPWTTGFFKTPIQGPAFVSSTNIAGDGQADLVNHGGVDKAVLAYSADHYPRWRSELHIPDLPYGAFGENLTISGLTEETVCIGDKYRVGPVIFEVSQPRQPCWKLARRWRMHELTAMVVQNGRSGWYLRVLQPGPIEAKMPVERIERPNSDWSIARANEIMNHHPNELQLALALANVPKLADSWVEELYERAARLGTPDTLG